MKKILIFAMGDLDARGERLVRLAASRGWFLPFDGRWGQDKPNVIAAPEGWQIAAHGAAVVRHSDGFGFLAGRGPAEDTDEWLAVRNGRYALRVRDDLLEAAAEQAEADIVAVTVRAEFLAYREKIVANSQGRVLGFRRFYHDETSPAAMPAGFPHALLVRTRNAQALGEGLLLTGRFDGAVENWRKAGLVVKSAYVGGEVRDLSSDDDLRALWRARAKRAVFGATTGANARLEGDVAAERGARVGKGAVVTGPTFIGRGAQIGEGALVSDCIIGPDAAVAGGGVVRERVVLSGDSDGGQPVGRRGQPQAAASHRKADAFREWPFLSYARLGKRIVDIVGSIIALAFLVTIFPIVVVAIKVNSGGPIFYTHKRQGLHGKEFSCFKFRTMLADGGVTREELRAINEVDGPQFKVEHDPRITLVGEFLRETNIDEVPQFLNVLAGQMSIVGPRPSPDEENQMCPAWRDARLSVRPGITGLWQVLRSPDRKNDFQEWIYYDTEYVRTLSFRQDTVIMAKTVGVILHGFAQLFVTKKGA